MMPSSSNQHPPPYPSSSPAQSGRLIRVEPLQRLAGIPRVMNFLVDARSNLMFILSLIIGMVIFFSAQYTFWAIFEMAARAANLPVGRGFLLPVVTTRGWPNDLAVLPALLASSGAVYLILDRAGLMGNTRAKKILWDKAGRVMPEPMPPTSFFVEVRARSRHLHLPQDIGYLFFYPDRLEFIGDKVRATVPREQIAGDAVLDQNIGNLAAAWLTVPLHEPWGRLRFLARGNARRLSETDGEARELQQTLSAWTR